MIDGKLVWLQAEDPNEDISVALIIWEQLSISVLFKGALPANCIVRAERLKNGEKLYERQYLSPRPPPKISLRHDLNWSKGKDQGSTVEHRPVGKLVQQSLGKHFNLVLPSQPNPQNPLKIDRGNP